MPRCPVLDGGPEHGRPWTAGRRPAPEAALAAGAHRAVRMTAGRPAVMWGVVAAHAAAAGRRVSVADVCAIAVSCAQVTGAWVTAASGQGPDFVMCVTDPVSEQLAELQLTLGEGPCHDVLATGRAGVLVRTWTMESPAAAGPRSRRRHAGWARGRCSRSR